MIRKLALHYPPTLVFNLNYVNNCSSSFESHIPIWSGIVTFNRSLVYVLDSVFLYSDTEINCTYSTDNRIHIRINE